MSTAGADVSVVAKWGSHVVHDRELISGQNPFSDEALLKFFYPHSTRRRNEPVRAITQELAPARCVTVSESAAG